ncbi:galactan 5-O-arabinofuranosyltransferase [Corynebacterium sp. NPDC060344]|uniref:galactan 5-O-arabinofuranosyltransferase n=1 Tax=Corynebacterium sp. NPDC060344 TaxID=3347101 RepID=UPI00365357F1
MADSTPAPTTASTPDPGATATATASRAHHGGSFATDPVGEVFADDQLSLKHAAIGMVAATIGGAALAFVAWFVLRSMSLPAFGGSMVTRAISSAVTVVLLLAVTVLLYFWATRGAGARPRWMELLTYAAAYLSPAALVVSTLAIPLGSTRLYLDGISIDQEFRTEYLTRMTAEFGLNDMAYIDVPSYYPAGWFFAGGRLANLLGMPGWEIFQPWALITLAAGGCLLVPVWQRLSGSLPVAAGIALLTTAITISTTADEPYAAIVAMGLPPLAIMARRALAGAWSALIGVIVFLGFSATFYTLHTAVGALIVITLTAAVCVAERSWRPVVKLVVMGAGSMLIAATVWAPYLWATLTGAPSSGATAMNYLPDNGARVPLPMFAASVIGLMCLLGLIWMLVRVLEPDTRAMIIGLAVMYGWVVASMIATLAGRTLLGFRLETPITLMLATAGVFAIADMKLNGVEKLWPEAIRPSVARAISAVLAAVILLAGVGYAQSIPNRLHGPIDLAHTDTDGYGERADRFAPDAGAHFPAVDAALREAGLDPAQSVVLTDERNFQAFFPWYSFQALTSHYANPLGEFDRRNGAIGEWADITDPDELIAAMDADPWRGPDAIIVRGDSTDPDSPYTLDVADDIYPNNPNVLFRGVAFDPAAFEGRWSTTQVGPFVVLIRQ